jgi:hypothetical protein
MAEQDPYKILGVRWNATDEAIGKAYRAKVRLYHPDVNKEPGADEKFQEIQQAFETLSDPVKRTVYHHTKAQATPPPTVGVYNSAKLYRRSSVNGMSDRFVLIALIVICLVVVQLILALVTFFIGWSNSLSDHPLTNDKLSQEGSPVGFVIIIVFLIFLVSIIVSYWATHRDN